MGEDPGNDQRSDHLAAKHYVCFDCLRSVFFAAKVIKSLVKRFTLRHRQAQNLGLVLGRLS